MLGPKSIRILLVVASVAGSGCQLLGTLDSKITADDSINLPFMKNIANECYYLDEYMPMPDVMVKGRNGPLNLRYYTYKTANYKEWKQQSLILSFYSQDEKCWSLFEEYLVVK